MIPLSRTIYKEAKVPKNGSSLYNNVDDFTWVETRSFLLEELNGNIYWNVWLKVRLFEQKIN